MAKGGSVYEKQMVGERPSSKPHHFNYEADMRGEHTRSSFAAGGVAKMRKGVSNAAGMPIMKRTSKGM